MEGRGEGDAGAKLKRKRKKHARMESRTFMSMHGYIWNEVKIINGERIKKTLSPPFRWSSGDIRALVSAHCFWRHILSPSPAQEAPMGSSSLISPPLRVLKGTRPQSAPRAGEGDAALQVGASR